MQYPQDLQISAGANVVGVANVVLVSLPILGAGLRYRAWAFNGCCFNTFTAATIRMALTRADGSSFAGISFHSTTASCEVHIPGGFLFPVGDSPRINAVASAATANLWLGSIMYTIERV